MKDNTNNEIIKIGHLMLIRDKDLNDQSEENILDSMNMASDNDPALKKIQVRFTSKKVNAIFMRPWTFGSFAKPISFAIEVLIPSVNLDIIK